MGVLGDTRFCVIDNSGYPIASLLGHSARSAGPAALVSCPAPFRQTLAWGVASGVAALAANECMAL